MRKRLEETTTSHSWGNQIGNTFLAGKICDPSKGVEDMGRPVLPEIWNRYSYRSKHHKDGFFKKALITVSFIVGALWLTSV